MGRKSKRARIDEEFDLECREAMKEFDIERMSDFTRKLTPFIRELRVRKRRKRR
jgi:hypothetical protein|tara:strand:- start:435 stop:596 length:162 start_codon:yes stop_codon:yes gene_type:complete